MRPDRPGPPTALRSGHRDSKPRSQPPEASSLSPEIIQQAVEQARLRPLTLIQAEQFSTYAEVLGRWNAKLNLTAVRDPQSILERHFVESIQCAQHLPSDVASLLDFGSGAGFPGIPIAICRPEISVVLLEATNKKASFLREAVRSLSISASVFSGRADSMPAGLAFDAVTMRAVDKMESALPAAIERVIPGGYLVLMTTGVEDWSVSLGGLALVSRLRLSNSSNRIVAILRKP